MDENTKTPVVSLLKLTFDHDLSRKSTGEVTGLGAYSNEVERFMDFVVQAIHTSINFCF